MAINLSLIFSLISFFLVYALCPITNEVTTFAFHLVLIKTPHLFKLFSRTKRMPKVNQENCKQLLINEWFVNDTILIWDVIKSKLRRFQIHTHTHREKELDIFGNVLVWSASPLRFCQKEMSKCEKRAWVGIWPIKETYKNTQRFHTISANLMMLLFLRCGR